MNNLKLFYNFYQTLEISQRVDLQKDRNKYLLPEDHPQYNELTQTVWNKETAYGFDGFSHSVEGYLVREGKVAYSKIQHAQLGPGSSDRLRVVMNHFLKNKTHEKNLNLIIPDEYLVYKAEILSSNNLDSVLKNGNQGLTSDHFRVVSQKLDILKAEKTRETLENLDKNKQQEIATTICRLIYHTGFMDAHFGNMALTTDNQMAIIDTEGHSLLCEANEKDYTPTSLVNARIIGLKEFISRIGDTEALKIFTQTAKKYLFLARVMKVVKVASIFFSILCPAIPLIVLICSVAHAKFKAMKQRQVQNNINTPLLI